MTAYCISSTSRSRPLSFMLSSGGDERRPQQPVPPNISVDTPNDDEVELPNLSDSGPPDLMPPKKPHLPRPNEAD